MTDMILAMIVCLIFGVAVVYIRKEKKRGNTCIGCPHASNCNNKKCK